MPPKKKKSPKNAYYFFMVQFRGDMERKGHKFPGGMKDVAMAADPYWKQLSAEERLPFESAAAEAKRRERGNMDNKFTTQGISYAVIERIEREKRELEYRMNDEIESTVRALDYSTTLPTKQFYFIHLNYYCRTENDLYIPCEVALVEFTFLNGVTKSYHTLIDPQVVPLGYSLDARKNSEDTHQIPLPPNELGERDYNQLFRKIKTFIQDAQIGDKLPPLYTVAKLIPAIKNFLLNLTDHVQEPDNLFRVYPLPKLFFELRNACANHPDSDGKGGFPVLSLAERELERDVFNFTPGICCDFHDKTDATQHCSLSYVKRWCYLICDHGCQDLDIELIPGRHIPMYTDTARYLKATGKPRPEPPLQQLSDRKSRTQNVPQSPIAFKPPSMLPEHKLNPISSDLTPLRKPKTLSLARAMTTSPPQFTDEDFPPIFGNDPVVVAGRGRGLPVVKQKASVPIGRGRGLAANFKSLTLK